MSEWRLILGTAYGSGYSPDGSFSQFGLYQREHGATMATVFVRCNCFCGSVGSQPQWSAYAKRQVVTHVNGVAFVKTVTGDATPPHNVFTNLADAQLAADHLARELNEWLAKGAP